MDVFGCEAVVEQELFVAVESDAAVAVDDAFGRAGSAGGEHDEDWMCEGDLLECENGFGRGPGEEIIERLM